MGSRDNIKIGDLGISCMLNEGSIPQFADKAHKLGSMHYRPPEVGTMGTAKAEDSVGRTSDMWALGCILSEMVTGEFVANRSDHFDCTYIFQSPQCVEWIIAETRDRSKFFGEIVSKLLDFDPSVRMKIGELCAELEKAKLKQDTATHQVDWAAASSQVDYVTQLEQENKRLVEMVETLQAALKHTQEMQRVLMESMAKPK